MVGQVDDRFEYDRQRLLEAVRGEAQRAIEGYDAAAEAKRLAGSVRDAVAQTALLQVSAVGLGTIVAVLASTTVADVTGILAAGALSVIGLFVLPREAPARAGRPRGQGRRPSARSSSAPSSPPSSASGTAASRGSARPSPPGRASCAPRRSASRRRARPSTGSARAWTISRRASPPFRASVELSWDEPQPIGEIVLKFDTGFPRELTLTAADSINRGIARAPQPETVRDYSIVAALPDGREKTLATVVGNHQRLNCLRVDPVRARAVRVVVTRTNGLPEARIFEVRCYPPAS